MSRFAVDIMAEFDRLLLSGPLQHAGRWQAVYAVFPEFTGFSGHFPDYPLMPALMQVLLAQHFVGKVCGEPGELLDISVAKFTGQIRPGDRVAVSAALLSSGEAESVWNFKLYSSGVENPAINPPFDPEKTDGWTQAAGFRLGFRTGAGDA